MSETSSLPKLDAHNQQILAQYRTLLPLYTRMCQVIPERIRAILDDTGLVIAGLESRVKQEGSLVGKLVTKGGKYGDLFDITDILGIRVITFYVDDVDKVASLLERHLDIDWENSVDKRKAHDIDSFGYLSLHYICRIPESLFQDPEHPEINQIRFEVQMRTILQHAWANLNHDTGYKSGVEVPKEYLRNLGRLAGMLELIDEQFSQIRRELTEYRRRVQSLVASGNLTEVQLDGDSFRSYLNLDPFGALTRRIAAVNQAEIQPASLASWLNVFKGLGFETLGDLEDLIHGYSEAAFQIACYQIGLTDLDIISTSVAPQNLCVAYLLKNGSGKAGLRYFFDLLNGESDSNEALADMLLEDSRDLPFMNQ